MKYFLNISGIFDADWDFPYKIIQNDFLFLEFQKIIFLEFELVLQGRRPLTDSDQTRQTSSHSESNTAGAGTPGRGAAHRGRTPAEPAVGAPGAKARPPPGSAQQSLRFSTTFEEHSEFFLQPAVALEARGVIIPALSGRGTAIWGVRRYQSHRRRSVCLSYCTRQNLFSNSTNSRRCATNRRA